MLTPPASLFSATARTASSCASVALNAVVKRPSSMAYFAGISWMMTLMEFAASRKPDVSAMLTDISRKMPRYFPRLFLSSRGKRLISGDAMAPTYQERSHAGMRALLALSSASTPSRRRRMRCAMPLMASLCVTMTMVQPKSRLTCSISSRISFEVW